MTLTPAGTVTLSSHDRENAYAPIVSSDYGNEMLVSVHAMIDSAFFDRMHCYIPGWEIPKMRPEYFTDNYGFISDYIAEFMREMRKTPQTDAFDKYFKVSVNHSTSNPKLNKPKDNALRFVLRA